MDYSLYICRTGELGVRAERDELKTDGSQDQEFGEDVVGHISKGSALPCYVWKR